ncbi:MAG: ATP-dependent zinc metalloprotease FtsH [Proteobacteria bacterium]|nr:ATP-dependent zinc metalloprotease FtsH [Pseudomonadota bacterium]MBU1737808.1 ATP-dependent zinc metalloprotease FtsH [Pseudomonadota bacterium]
MKFYIRLFSILFVLFIISITVYNVLHAGKEIPEENYSSFLARLEKNEIKEVHLKGGHLTATDIHNKKSKTFIPEVAPLLPVFEEKGITVSASPEAPGILSSLGAIAFSILVFFVVLILYIYRHQSKDTGAFGKSKIAPFQSKHKILFADVAGVPEAKEDLVEIVEFLKNPGRYSKLGGKIPKGVLLQGAPGTGKTLLAKAIAGEANVPFFSISGSDFVEMFVGVGASRVRDLFKEAKKNAPCIVFIDEIDAVGRSRGSGAGMGGGHDEREQTLNALLVEMDGFETGDTVIIVAATNRPDVLDPALLRPGRFDRQVTIMPPDVVGREKILRLYMKKVVMAADVKLDEIARSTPGFTGAELANLINEAALMAARKEKDAIDTIDIEEAKDKILMGAERKGMVISDKERKTTAYHEAGHAIMALLLPGADPLHKITIIPRGRAMGVTQQVQLDDRHAYSKEYLENRIKILLGGRTAEEIVFNKFSTGASNDLQRATEIATKMVCEWGMSSLLGPRAYTFPDEGFLGGDGGRRLYSEKTASAIDKEINTIIENCYQEAMIILEGKIDLMHSLANKLLEKETLGPEQIREVIASGLDLDPRVIPLKRKDNVA